MLQTNVYSGFGMLYFRDGSYYIGNFKDGKQHAFGIYKWSDGRSYEGYWWDGEKHGIGRFYQSQQSQARFGLWEHNKRYIQFYGLRADGVTDIDEVHMRQEGIWMGTEHIMLDYRLEFKFPESSQQVQEYATFNRAPNFMMRVRQMDQVAQRLIGDKDIKEIMTKTVKELELRKDI